MHLQNSDFIHLHVHSDYSLLDGCARIERLCKQAKDMGMSALALTDHGNVFGWVDFFKTAKLHGIKPLLGCEVYLVYDYKRTERPEKNQAKYYHMGLIAQNRKGYHNLSELVSDAYVSGFYYKPRTDMEVLAKYSEGLIGFTGCLQGVVPQFLLHGEYEKARKAMGDFVDIFGRDRYFVELQNHDLPEQLQIAPELIKLATEFGLKIICSNDVHYVDAKDWQPHDSLLCIQTAAKISDEKRLRYTSHEFYLKSEEQMRIRFGERPDAITNTRLIAEMVDLALPFGENHYPHYTLAAELKPKFESNYSYVRSLCTTGLEARYNIDSTNLSDPRTKMLVDRIDYELGIIRKAGFIDYFLIVWDFIHWARNEGIPVGPGRGSGAGSLVAYTLKITDIDPIRFGLFFERFLNPERVSPPDFDIDFCVKRRADVIEYVRQKYGKDCVANIITFGTFGARMIIRDLARVLDLPYSEGDRMSKMVPDELGITLESAIEKSAELKNEIKTNIIFQKIFDQGKVIEGMVRNTGTHAAGVIICDQPLSQLIPLTVQEGALTTQFPKDPLEELGLLKVDFLGLKTLTIIADAVDSIHRTRPELKFDIETITLEDSKTFELISQAKTVGVFQIESGGMQSLCRQLQVNKVDEIIDLIALYRPGPMELIPDYIRGKKNPTSVEYLHPSLEKICKETYGIMIYQEQVMEAARLIAGYTLGGADVLRRAMGKKKPEEMELQRAIFTEGAKKHHNISKEKADAIFNLLEKFAGYGFNKSHSAAYAVLAYRTAYLKANFPVEFMAAILSNELGHADKVAHFIEECSAMHIPVLGPDINFSGENFTPVIDDKAAVNTGSIRFGIGAIKGVGDVAAKNILSERASGGYYKSFEDFIARVDARTVNKRVLECLIKSGSFDFTCIDRQHLLDSLEGLMKEAAVAQKDKAQGQGSLFDLMDEPIEKNTSSQIKTSGPSLSQIDKLNYERELLGFYVSGHPLQEYAGLIDGINSFKPDDFLSLEDRTPFRLCGIVSGITKKLTKKDNRPWAYFTLDTQTGAYVVNVYPETYEQYHDMLTEGTLAVVIGNTQVNNGEIRLNAQELTELDKKLPSLIRSVRFVLTNDARADEFLNELAEWVHSVQGSTKIELEFQVKPTERLHAEIANSLKVKIDTAHFQKLRTHPALLECSVVGSDINLPARKYR
jgi:DNA polymerase III subunit alpha